ncbi:hypothetical protein AQUCO_05300116v1 [Aquilegia coerulea]|uniref:RING-type domain-containing protein n=1 Tax=Aquilegia coerulea TaxID=218851 RepID=A0A2G5CII4_AQUCA|nr:hypothetical protein AQUCO_05300116v1 [Aquilegia coerulea]
MGRPVEALVEDAFEIYFEQLQNYDCLEQQVHSMLQTINSDYSVFSTNNDSLVIKRTCKEIAYEAFKLNQRSESEAFRIQRVVHLEVRNMHFYDNEQEYDNDNSLSEMEELQVEGDFAETILGLVETASMEEDTQKVQKGASRASIDALERTIFREEELKEDEDGVTSCSVCREDFLMGEEISKMPCSSSHIFHTGCIGKWLEVSNICPLCRHQMPIDDSVSM